jgi:hypothetical protein
MGVIQEPLDSTEPLVMPSKVIRVPIPAWINFYLEQYREHIDTGLFLIFLLLLVVIPLVFLYLKKKPPSGLKNWCLLTGAMLGVFFASLYASYLLAMSYPGAEIFAVIPVSIVMAFWRFERLTVRAYTIRALGILILLVLTIDFFVPRVASSPEAAMRMACSKNLKTLGFGLIEANKKTLSLGNAPPHNEPQEIGGPDVSWRIKLLPFLSSDHVYQKYELSSSWDSDTNWPVACQKVDPFICPSEPDRKSPKGGRFTSYVMLENTNRNPKNPNLVYDQDRKLLDANRILLIESCGANVVWTEPRDADVDTLRWSFKPANRKEEKEPWRSTNVGASSHPGTVQVVYGDGSTRSLSKSIDEGVLRKVILGQASADELD